MILTRSMIGCLFAAVSCVGVVGVAANPTASPVAAAAPSTVTCDPVPATETAPDVDLVSYDPMLPERIVDTRDGTGGVDAALGAGCTLIVETSAIGPADTVAIALSVTVISPVKGFFTAFPCAAGLPGTSSVNARAGFPTPNLVVATPDSAGRVCLYSNRGGDVIIDVSGWWADGPNRFTPIDPVRAYDTRELAAPVKLPAGDIRAVDVGGAFVPEDAVAVTVNLAAVAPEQRGFLVVYPCGLVPPLASNLNFKAGEKRAASAVVELGNVDAAAAGKICVTGSAETHFLLDVTGYMAPSSPTSPDLVLTPLPDTRVVDSREPGLPGVRFQPGVAQRFDLSASVDRPDDMVAAVLNVIAVRADRSAYASVYPCQSPPPTTSSLNYDLAQTSNLVVSALTDDGEICVVTNSPVEIVIDLVGVFTGPPGSLVNQLSLTNVDGEPVPLDQDFEIDGENSTLRCDGAVDLDLRLGLAPGVSAQVNGVAVADRDPVTPDVLVAFPDEGLVTVSLERGAETAMYHLRCLPTDFPPSTVTRTGDTAPGWYLTEFGWGGQGSTVFIAILDERGVPVWYKRTDRRLIDLKALSSGNLVASPVNGTGYGVDGASGHRIMDLDGNLVAEHLTDSFDFPVDHHDYREITGAPAGAGRAVISYSVKTGIDLRNLKLTSDPATAPCDPSVRADDQRIMDNTIREVDGDDTLLWQWSAYDHFSVEESTYALCFDNLLPDETAGADETEVDPFHINGLQRIEANGCAVDECDYMVTARHLDGVFRVDRATGDVEWILSSRVPDPGNVLPNDAKLLEIVDDPLNGPLRMHDARLVGDILTMHDNRTGAGDPSRVVTYRIDTTNGTATLIDQIDNPGGATSGAFGSARTTPDGSMLVDWGQLQPAFIEYDASGVELMRIEMPGQAAYRIVKYAADQFDAEVLRAAAGGSVEAPTP